MASLKSLFVAAVLVACGSSSAPLPVSPAPPPAHGEHGEHHAQHEHKGPVGHRFEKADDWVPMFDDPKRDEWQKPDAVVAALGLSAGMTVADVGAGTGYFIARLAAGVGAQGIVYAVDIEPDMVRYLKERATRENTPNVQAILAAPDDPKLPAGKVDRILVVDTWHHLPARADYAKKLAAALRPGGAIVVVDFTLETKRGPPPSHRLGPDVIRAELEGAGLKVVVVDAGLPDQYVLKAARTTW